MPDEPLGQICVICEEPIGVENDSREHVIAEAIGGRLTVKGFICARCNTETGHTWDATLASQLHPLSLIFDVKRQRGATPGLKITTTAGEELVINADGPYTLAKPSFTEEKTSEGAVTIKISARSKEEAKRILVGVKRKYPSIDADRMLADAQMSTSYPEGMVHHRLEFGGESSGRSIVKSVLAMAYHAGVPPGLCHDALEYLRKSSAVPCFGYYYETDLVAARPPEVPINCVSVEANPDTGLILGYAEYFGVRRVVVCLGRGYTGAPIRACYAIDPRTGGTLELSIRLGFNEADIKDIYDYKRFPDGAVESAFEKVMTAALKRKFEKHKERAISEAVKYGFANCGAKPGDILTKEHMWQLSRLVADRLTPFFLHQARSIPRARPTAHVEAEGGEPNDSLGNAAH